MLGDWKARFGVTPRKEAIRPYLLGAFLVLFGLCLAILLIEAFLRLFPFQLSRMSSLLAATYLHYRFEPDPFLIRKLKPRLNIYVGAREFSYSFRTVSLGYEGIGFRDDGINSECFAVAVGDSFTEGWGGWTVRVCG